MTTLVGRTGFAVGDAFGIASAECLSQNHNYILEIVTDEGDRYSIPGKDFYMTYEIHHAIENAQSHGHDIEPFLEKLNAQKDDSKIKKSASQPTSPRE
jgi:hypothetical protein